MNRTAKKAVPDTHPLNRDAVHVLKVFLVLGFIYLGVEAVGIFFQIQFFDTWPLLGAIAWDIAMHGDTPARAGLFVLMVVVFFGLTKLFERR